MISRVSVLCGRMIMTILIELIIIYLGRVPLFGLARPDRIL